MRLFVRLLWPLAAVVAVACSDGNTGPGTAIPRADLNGEYSCIRALGWASGAGQGSWVSEGGCTAYHSLTNPDRADSGETFPFTITSGDRLQRRDFKDGVVQYDPTTATAVVTFDGHPTETYVATYTAVAGVTRLVLIRRVPAFDYTGDGVSDSLELYFAKGTTTVNPGKS